MLAESVLFSQVTLSWLIPTAVVLFGLVIYGFKDLLRFSLYRARAISSVCFAESIRRRVLWITPLAMLGVVVISQLQRPLDDGQDAIRQVIKTSLFATGLVVTVTAIILACTNLPKEIESRVIFTIVTKPTTRLEILVGKTLGFAKVSLAILLLMGVFTSIFVHARAWTLRRIIAQRIDAGLVEAASRRTYEYWRDEGLLTSRSFERPVQLEIFAKPPTDQETRRWFFGSSEGEILVPFRITPQQLVPAGGEQPGQAGAFLRLLIGYDRNAFGEKPNADLPIGIAAPTAPAAPPRQALVRVDILDQNLSGLVESKNVNGGQPVVLTDPTGMKEVYVQISPEGAPNLARSPVFYVNIVGLSAGTIYSVDTRSNREPAKNPVSLIIPPMNQSGQAAIHAPQDGAAGDGLPASPLFRSRGGLYGQQLRGGSADVAPVALYKFRGSEPPSRDQKTVSLEMKLGIERSADDVGDPDSNLTQLELTFLNKTSGKIAGPVNIFPENNRTTYFNVPREAVSGGNFDLYVRNLSVGHYTGMLESSVALVAGEQSFEFNLAKSLLILWMLSILVVVIAIFCSTFLSWPIAIMLTLMILLGHWAVEQLGGTLAPGMGNQVVTDLFGTGGSAATGRVVSSTVEAMTKMLNTLGTVLPDITQFSAIDDIERGISIDTSNLLNPLLVLALFGLPLLTLSYIFLRNKEVAP
ncbi:MAG: ABC transporter permease subunit [Candidatus Kapaibacterium sp.]